MLNLDNMQVAEVRKFCGISVETGEDYTVMCVNEAVGEITGVIEEVTVTLPVCQHHLDLISEGLDNHTDPLV